MWCVVYGRRNLCCALNFVDFLLSLLPFSSSLQCNIVCSSQAELREHKKTCPRSHRDSASTQSLSTSDVEVLTDTSESLTSDEEEYGDNEEKTRKMVSPVPNERWGSKNNLAKGGREGGSGKGGEGGRQKPGEKKQRRKKRNVPTVKSAATFKQTQKKSRIRKALSEAVRLGAGHSSPPNDPSPGSTYGVGGEGILVPQNQGVYFGVGGSDSSESSDEEDNLEYTPAEMAQLLSLNELDMQPGTSESEEEEEEEEEVREKKGKNGREKRKDSSSDPRSSDKTSRQQQSRSAAHTRQPEPVGLFWDIENCSVPANKSAFAVAAKMRRIFFEGKREAEFMVVCDITKERKDVIDALNKAQVNSSVPNLSERISKENLWICPLSYLGLELINSKSLLYCVQMCSLNMFTQQSYTHVDYSLCVYILNGRVFFSSRVTLTYIHLMLLKQHYKFTGFVCVCATVVHCYVFSGDVFFNGQKLQFESFCANRFQAFPQKSAWPG